MGGQNHPATPGRWTAKGDEKPENAQLARERALKEAAEFGMIGLLASASNSDPNAPVVPWGNVLVGADRESHMGNLWSGDPGDAFGWGLGLEGTGDGGGGNGRGVGMNGISGLGHIGGTCTSGEHCSGIGHGGKLGGTYVPHGPSINWNPTITTNGRLDPAVIQRIVRLNSGRFMGCYKEGLVHNPSLSGRVSVAFVIARDGSVSTSQDTSGSDLADRDVRACVVKWFQSLSFPEPAGGIVSVTYPFAFTPNEPVVERSERPLSGDELDGGFFFGVFGRHDEALLDPRRARKRIVFADRRIDATRSPLACTSMLAFTPFVGATRTMPHAR